MTGHICSYSANVLEFFSGIPLSQSLLAGHHVTCYHMCSSLKGWHFERCYIRDALSKLNIIKKSFLEVLYGDLSM